MISSNAFSNKNFTILWLGAVTCLIGDQLSLIALPWLVLKLTNNALSVGYVLAMIGVPRAVFILIGGTLTDKFNPKNVLMYARAFSAVLLVLLALLVWFDFVTMFLLYSFALLLGLASAFTLPAGMAILPSLLPPEQLKTGSGVMMTSMQLSAVVGPILAGYVITAFSKSPTSFHQFSDALGISIIFIIDGFSFLASVLSLLAITFPKSNHAARQNDSKTSLFASISSGFNYLKSDRSLLMYILYIAMISFFITGPAAVGIPMMVQTKFLGTALEFGSFLTVQGVGMMLGMIFAIFLPTITATRLGVCILLLDAVAGMLVIGFAQSNTIFYAFGTLFLIGIIGGYIQVIAYTWIQTRTQPEYMGRVMSYFMFAAMGLAPISSVISGYIITYTSASMMFTIAGTMIMIVALLGLKSTGIRKMGMNLNVA